MLSSPRHVARGDHVPRSSPRGAPTPPASAQHRADEEFTSFADELARNPDVEDLLLWLRHGHNPTATAGVTTPATRTGGNATRARASVWPIWSTSERGHLTQYINSEIGPFVLTPVTPSRTCGLNYTWLPALCYRTRGPRVPPRPWTWHDPDCDFADSRGLGCISRGVDRLLKTS